MHMLTHTHTTICKASEGWVSEACRSMQSDEDVKAADKTAGTRLLPLDHNLYTQGSKPQTTKPDSKQTDFNILITC